MFFRDNVKPRNGAFW